MNGIPTNWPATSTTYQWAVTGTTFQSWSDTTPAINPCPKYPAGAPANPHASCYVDGPGNLNLPQPSWYWNDAPNTSGKPATDTVKCTVSLNLPGGLEPTVVSASSEVNVYRPNFFASGTPGVMQVSNAEGPLELLAGPVHYPTVPSYGMYWTLSVTTPGIPVAFGEGNIELVQIVPAASGVPLVPTYHNFYKKTSTGEPYYDPNNELNLAPGLDTEYPYLMVSKPEYQGLTNLDVRDNPGFPVDDVDLTEEYASLHMGFEDILMYQPPNSSATEEPDSEQYVPLANFFWTADGQATEPTGGWVTSFTLDGAGVTTPSGTDFTASNGWPKWDDILTGTDLTSWQVAAP